MQIEDKNVVVGYKSITFRLCPFFHSKWWCVWDFFPFFFFFSSFFFLFGFLLAFLTATGKKTRNFIACICLFFSHNKRVNRTDRTEIVTEMCFRYPVGPRAIFICVAITMVNTVSYMQKEFHVLSKTFFFFILVWAVYIYLLLYYCSLLWCFESKGTSR